ncbi:CvpA family protein [Thermosulfurimonas sp. F29]|uniref:CvpA family protein n=1 Tax=Thermosulfurimonas sp. F29 TaxID=2867247 RepID=UPI001C831E1E|nr:CvpA family protein [Thermosulfurimonas sp. F29]MBX6423072.1 CvpA family protein [Thermosulfurimonas sp. F29]
MKLPWFDLVALAVILWFVIRTAWIGFFRGLSSLAGLVLGFIYAGTLAPRVEGILAPWFRGYPWFEAVCWLLAFTLIFLSVFILAEILTRIFEAAHLSFFNRLLGAALGLVKACVLLSVIFFFLVSFYPQGAGLVRRSVVAPFIFKTTRALLELVPSKWKHRFNYHWRHYFGSERKAI